MSIERMAVRGEGGAEFDINEMLVGELLPDGELWIHVKDVEEMRLADKLHLLKEGLRRLAYGLEHSSLYKDVRLISGTSWIVTKNPGLMERLGFTVDNTAEGFEKGKRAAESKLREKHKQGEGIEPSYAYMSREKFLELYGNKL